MNAKAIIFGLVRDGHAGATNNELAYKAGYSVVTVDISLRALESERKIARVRVGRRRQITVLQ